MHPTHIQSPAFALCACGRAACATAARAFCACTSAIFSAGAGAPQVRQSRRFFQLCSLHVTHNQSPSWKKGGGCCELAPEARLLSSSTSLATSGLPLATGQELQLFVRSQRHVPLTRFLCTPSRYYRSRCGRVSCLPMSSLRCRRLGLTYEYILLLSLLTCSLLPFRSSSRRIAPFVRVPARTGRSCGCDHHPTPSIASYARARASDHDRPIHRDDPSSAHGEVAGRGNSRARRFRPTHRLADLNFLAIVYRRNPDAVRDNPSLTDTPSLRRVFD